MKRFKQIKYIVLVTIVLFCCTMLLGCAPKEELGNTTVVTGLFLDYSFLNQTYTLIVETIDFSGYEKSKAPKTEQMKASGKTIAEAFARLNLSGEKELYYSHAKVMILGSGYKLLPVKHTVEYLMNDRAINSDLLLCFADFDAQTLQDNNTFSIQTITQFFRKENTPLKTKLYELYRTQEVFFLPQINLGEETISLEETAVFYENAYETNLYGDDNFIFRLLYSKVSEEPLTLKDFDILITKGTSNCKLKNNRFTADILLDVQLTDAKRDEIISPEMISEIKKTIETELTKKTTAFLMRLSKENKTQILPKKPDSLANFELSFQITVSQIGTLNQF